MALDGLVKVAVKGRTGCEKHSCHRWLLFVPQRRLSQRKHLGHTTLAAVISENGPIASAEFRLQASEIIRGGGHGALGIHTVVTHRNRVGHAAANDAVDRLAALFAD